MSDRDDRRGPKRDDRRGGRGRPSGPGRGGQRGGDRAGFQGRGGPRGPKYSHASNRNLRVGPAATPNDPQFKFLVTAGRGTEPMLRRELRDLGLTGLSEVPGGVKFKGTFAEGQRATLWSRIGMRVLLEIGRGKIDSGDDLYHWVRSLALPQWFNADATIAVFAATIDCGFRDDRFASMRTKDAIVDAMRDRHHRRPDVNGRDPDISVSLRANAGDAHLYLDMAGGPLSRRGTRVRSVDAPVRENLAAALLQYSGWDGRKPLHDPTCGGGTIAIEAAGIATKSAPALGRTLGFQRWPVYVTHLADTWSELVAEAEQVRKSDLRGVIIASDIDKDAVRATRNNLAAAGFLNDVVVRKADARETGPLLNGGYFVFNPPYGERIGGEDDEVGDLYDDLAARLLGFDDHTVALISTAHALREGFGGAEPTREVDAMNGRLPCKLVVYEQ